VVWVAGFVLARGEGFRSRVYTDNIKHNAVICQIANRSVLSLLGDDQRPHRPPSRPHPASRAEAARDWGAVSAAAEVQPPTIYRQFGDMQGLLSEVARAGFNKYLESKMARVQLRDPVEEMKRGWNLHVEFGLTHPHLYRLMYTALRSDPDSNQAFEMLRGLLQRVAEAGRLSVSVERAGAMVHGGALGVTLSLLNAPVKDTTLSDLMLNAVLGAILTPETAPVSTQLEPRVAGHAVALVSLLPKLETTFSPAEHKLLEEWLHRLM
jgi:AcrR family transcriptional regulator